MLESNDRGDTDSVPIVFAVLRTGGLFSIENNQDDARNVMTSVGSPVVSLTVGVDKTFTDLPDPVIVNVRILVQVRCYIGVCRSMIKILVFFRILQTHAVYLMTLTNKVYKHFSHTYTCVNVVMSF